ncbi:MAG: type II toxin-antitoxin system RelB/DinJ family antitoxin [Victivallales bacterium]|nr:type II toxin-antitoxin system RelB/DinJ family antitoxin [Victivallales bacterium]
MSDKPKSTNISIRMDLDLKRDAETLFANLGMNLSTAFNVFLRQSLRVQGLPFPVKLDFSSSLDTDSASEKTPQESREEK